MSGPLYKEAGLDKIQDSYEKLDADMRVLSGETAGFYRIRHQIRRLEDQGGKTALHF